MNESVSEDKGGRVNVSKLICTEKINTEFRRIWQEIFEYFNKDYPKNQNTMFKLLSMKFPKKHDIRFTFDNLSCLL